MNRSLPRSLILFCACFVNNARSTLRIVAFFLIPARAAITIQRYNSVEYRYSREDFNCDNRFLFFFFFIRVFTLSTYRGHVRNYFTVNGTSFEFYRNGTVISGVTICDRVIEGNKLCTGNSRK